MLMHDREKVGWGARIRTWEWRYQKPLPYHLATPQPCDRLVTGRGMYPGFSQDATALLHFHQLHSSCEDIIAFFGGFGL